MLNPRGGEAIGTSAEGGEVLAETQVELARESRRHATGVGGEFSQQGGGRRGYTDQVRCADQARCSGTSSIHGPGGVEPISGRQRKAARGGGHARR
jgi:hypothetical protein